MIDRRRVRRLELGIDHWLMLLVILAVMFVQVRAARGAKESATHALLINGGNKASSNVQSHLHHLEDMVVELEGRGLPRKNVHVFSADGEAEEKDLAVREPEDPNIWILKGTRVGKALRRVELKNTVWDGITLNPARLGALRQWFLKMRDELKPGDVLLVFVTDHGTRNKEDANNGFISLWEESLSVLEFRALLSHLSPGVRVVNVMSQCYSGAFADAMAPFHSDIPSGDVCGFYSTRRDRRAYGCYPEGRDRDRFGHAFRFIDAMKRQRTMAGAHQEVLITDTTPDVPLRTSDLYLEQLFERLKDERDLPIEEIVDEHLRRAWRDRAYWEPEIRVLDRLGEIYGTFSPRTLSEIKDQISEFSILSKDLDTYEHRWSHAFDDLKRENLARFIEENPSWETRLGSKALDQTHLRAKKKLLSYLLPALLEFTQDREEVWQRLTRLRETWDAAKTSKFRIQVRLAALLRMRAYLIRIAGLELLGVHPSRDPVDDDLLDEAAALKGLLACEDSEIGLARHSGKSEHWMADVDPLASFGEDLDTLKRVLPSWLGIQSRAVSDDQREEKGLGRGAVVVRKVYPDSPAEKAGFRPGDIVIGPPMDPFDEPRRIGEWTMQSPRGEPLPLEILRPAGKAEVVVTLEPYPTKLPELPGPPDVGDRAPGLGPLPLVSRGPKDEGPDIQPVPAVLDVAGQRHLLYFWATWCGPCNKAIPEMLAWSEQAEVQVVAITDEDEETIQKFLKKWANPFPALIVRDQLRGSFLSHGVSGTPTFVLVDEDGSVEWRQRGYKFTKGFAIEGWDWSTLEDEK